MISAMPKFVDHDRRRREVAEVAAQLISEGGPDAVTVRSVAQAAGYSTAVVSHYFADKRELLLATYRVSSTLPVLQAVVDENPCDLRGVLEALLPLTPARRRDWRVYFAYWGMAIADDDLADEQRRRVREVQRLLADAVAALKGAGKTAADVEPREAGRHLMALVMGIAAQALFDPADWPAARQMALVDAELTGLGIAVPGRQRGPSAPAVAG
jgi:AcrR family transcriptional regulator